MLQIGCKDKVQGEGRAVFLEKMSGREQVVPFILGSQRCKPGLKLHKKHGYKPWFKNDWKEKAEKCAIVVCRMVNIVPTTFGLIGAEPEVKYAENKAWNIDKGQENKIDLHGWQDQNRRK